MRSCADRARLALVAAAALAACGVSSPATEVKEALARLAPVELPAGAVRVAVERAAFSDVVVSPDGPRALVLAMVDADARVRLPGGDATLAYVGREAFAMERCAGRRWCLAPDALAALRGAAAALAGAPRGFHARPVAWQVRVERDGGEAGEDYEGYVGERRERLRRRWALVRDGDAWRAVPAP